MSPMGWTGRSRSRDSRRRWPQYGRSQIPGGELVNRESPFFPLRNAVFDLPPYRGKWPEIWIAAHGPRMLRATGRYADAWFPAFPHRPEDYAQRRELVRAAASDAGRDPMAILPAVEFLVVTGASRDAVAEALNSEVLKALSLTASDEVFARHGAWHPLGQGSPDLRISCRTQWMSRRPCRTRLRYRHRSHGKCS
jgi:alkanesulfonate monooxygenase SsuD/methylene tetrahydromethanopterin reductase-like flavin-dependent oxidoreductase (luciferase family)